MPRIHAFAASPTPKELPRESGLRLGGTTQVRSFAIAGSRRALARLPTSDARVEILTPCPCRASRGLILSAYLIAQIKITRPQGWPEYREAVGPLTERFGGRYIVRAVDIEVLEGSHYGRSVVIFEFPSMEAIRSFWSSPEYEEVKKLRESSGQVDVWAVPGL
jgi:uncharacterized protein (DUF1330 family)